MLTLKKSSEFQDVFKSGKWSSSDTLVTYSKKIKNVIKEKNIENLINR